ncbi:MAG: tetratricopeptide repeat-containing sensor histidine kinase [Flavobacteriia bacterium]|nr:tetratricopeptide repeat-containing sensor histidine kinase [Flavobacteriia bacterium]
MQSFIRATLLFLLLFPIQGRSHSIDTASLEDRVYELYEEVRVTPLLSRESVDHLLHQHKNELPIYLEAWLYEIKGDSYYMVSQYDSAIHYFLYARHIMEQDRDSVSLAYNDIYLAEAYNEMGLHEEAAKHFFTARNYFVAVGDTFGLIDVGYGLSLLFYDREEYRSSLKHIQESIELARILEDSSYFTSLFTQLSSVYLQLGNADTATLLARKALEIDAKLETSKLERAYALGSLADALNELGLYHEARLNLDTAMALSTDINDLYATIYFRTAIARNHWGKGEYDVAWELIQDVLDDSERLGIKSGLRYALRAAVDLSREEGDFKKALFFSDSLQSFTKDLLNDNFELVMLESELNKALATSEQLKREKQINDLVIQRNSALLVLALLAAIGAGIAWYFQYRGNQRMRKLNGILEERNKMISRQNTQLDEQTRVLTENQKLLKKSNADKDKLLTLISHDLRSPLAQVKSVSELILSGAVNEEEMKTFFQRINESADKSLANLTDVLVWARSQMDKGMTSSSDAVDAKEAIETAYGLVQSNFESKEIAHQIECANPAPQVQCDESHLGIILRNLLSNAAKFSHRGQSVRTIVKEDGAWVHFVVEDKGVGMTEEVRKKIFEEGRRTSERGTELESGTGTGLQLVREFTEANGGRLEIFSREGKGTSISVSFRKL